MNAAWVSEIERKSSGVVETVLLSVPRYSQSLDRERWREHGFESVEDSDVWSDRACGVACAAMVLDYARGGPVSVVDLLHEGRVQGAFCDRGWIHAGLATLLTRHGVSAVAEQIGSVDDLLTILCAGHPVIVSVTLQFPEDGSQGGHLILVTGVTREGDRVVTVHFNDPSRWGVDNHCVTAERFAASFTGRIVRPTIPALMATRVYNVV